MAARLLQVPGLFGRSRRDKAMGVHAASGCVRATPRAAIKDLLLLPSKELKWAHHSWALYSMLRKGGL